MARIESGAAARGVRPGLLALLAAALGALAFAPSLGGDFVYDDREIILENPYVHSLVWAWRWFTTDFLDTGIENSMFVARLGYYRPLVTASYAFDWVLGGGAPDPFHVTNLAAHGLVSALVFLTLRRWLGQSAAAFALPVFLATVLFALHPTKAESVAWISGRTDVFCLLFVLLACLGASRRMAGRRGGLALEIAGTAGAYLAKETAIVLPAFIAVEAWCFAGRPALDRAGCVRLARAAAPQLGLALVYLAARSVLLPVTGTSGMVPAFATPLARVATVLETFGRTSALLFVPEPLMVQQGLFELDANQQARFSAPYLLLGALTIVGLGLGIAWTRRRAPAVCLGLLLFLVCLLPVSHVLPTRMQTFISERFFYLPTFGLALALGAGLGSLGRHRLALALCVPAALVFGALSVRRSFDYRDERAFWGHEVRVNPNSVQARRKLVQFATEDRRFDDALRELVRVHELATTRSTFRSLAADSIVEAVDLLAFLTPDSSQAELADLARFCDDAATRQRATLRLRRAGLNAEISVRGGDVATRLAVLRPKLLATRAELSFRLGSEADARAEAERVLEACPGCSELGRRAALVLARTLEFARAERVLEELAGLLRGEQRLATALANVREARRLMELAERGRGALAVHARASAYQTLGAYGRAYAVLAPHEAELAVAPDAALGYAKIAWLAGYPEVTERVLALHVPKEKIAELTASWPHWTRP